MWSSTGRVKRWGGRAAFFGFAAVQVFAYLLVVPQRAAAIDEEGCYRCHGLDGFNSRSGSEVRQLSIVPERFEASVHWPLNCRECHAEVAAIPHLGVDREVSCGHPCHQSDQAGNEYSHESLFWEFSTSAHGGIPEKRIACTFCHPAASLVEAGRRDKLEEVRQCTSCHRRSIMVRRDFQDVHYRALAAGDRRAASCSDCHTVHRVKSSEDTESSTHRERMAETCGSGAMERGGCHGALSPKAVRGAGMNPLVRDGRLVRGVTRGFSFVYWGLLLGLLGRAGLGLLRKR
jgi:hypothetical protein